MQHILGDVISPPIIGAISDASGSLRTGVNILPIFILLSGIFWFLGFAFVTPLANLEDDKKNGKTDVSFYKILCEPESAREPPPESQETRGVQIPEILSAKPSPKGYAVLEDRNPIPPESMGS